MSLNTSTISLLVAMTASCGAYYEIGRDTPLMPPTQPWAESATEGAVRFWAGHGVRFDVGDPTGYAVVVADLPPDRIAQCGYGQIDLIPALAPHAQEARCATAHELGHLIGMEHVPQSESLMAPVVTLPPDATTCYWSVLDQTEFEAAMKRGRSACP